MFGLDLPYSCVASVVTNRVRKGAEVDEYGCIAGASGKRSQLQRN